MMNRIKVGCCGFPRGKKKYFQQFKLVEIQQTFYKPPCANPLERRALQREIGYFRLHGGRNYRHQHTDDELARLWELSGNEAYVLFNNIDMYDDALRFQELIRSKR